jgi:hypothetical protein
VCVVGAPASAGREGAADDGAHSRGGTPMTPTSAQWVRPNALGNRLLPKTTAGDLDSEAGARRGGGGASRAGSGRVTCGDPGPGRENVARSNLDLAVLAPAGDKENVTTQRVSDSSQPDTFDETSCNAVIVRFVVRPCRASPNLAAANVVDLSAPIRSGRDPWEGRCRADPVAGRGMTTERPVAGSRVVYRLADPS